MALNAPANPSRPTFDRSTAAVVDAMDCRSWMENGEVESTHGRLLLPRHGTRRINVPANPSRPTFDRSTAAMVNAMDCRNWMEIGGA